MFSAVGDLLKTYSKRSRTPEAILALQVRQIAISAIKRICTDLPPEVFEMIRVKSFKNKTLTVSAPSLVCAELQTRAGGLIDDINKTIGRRIVERIRFRIS